MSTNLASSRRSFLRMLLPAVAAPAMIEMAEPAQAAALPVIIEENPNLIGAADCFELAHGTFKAALSAKEQARRIFFEAVPPMPHELRIDASTRAYMSGCIASSHIVGRGWDRWEIKPEDWVSTPTFYRMFVEQLELVKRENPARSRRGRFVRRMIPIAERYERAIAASARKSKILVAYHSEAQASFDAMRAFTCLFECQPATSRGLHLQARAANEAASFDFYDHYHLRGVALNGLAANVARVFGGELTAIVPVTPGRRS
jgi:hypothetical protein